MRQVRRGGGVLQRQAPAQVPLRDGLCDAVGWSNHNRKHLVLRCQAPRQHAVRRGDIRAGAHGVVLVGRWRRRPGGQQHRARPADRHFPAYTGRFIDVTISSDAKYVRDLASCLLCDAERVPSLAALCCCSLPPPSCGARRDRDVCSWLFQYLIHLRPFATILPPAHARSGQADHRHEQVPPLGRLAAAAAPPEQAAAVAAHPGGG